MTPFPTPYELLVSVTVAAFARTPNGNRALTLGQVSAHARELLDQELVGRVPCALVRV